jgi:hypothetical protein
MQPLQSQRINDAIGCEGITWEVNNLDNMTYQLIPDTKECCVATGHFHNSYSHSCVHVYKTYVVCNCFSHGKRVVEGQVSRAIREIFFDISDNNNIVDVLISVAKENHLARENGCVLKRVGTTYAYEHVDEYRDFITSTLRNNRILTTQPRRFNDLMMFMNNVDNDDFPFVKRDKRYIGFTNGLLDIVEGELVENDVLEHGVIPRHYINQCCDLQADATPLLDKILCNQLGSDQIYTYMLAFIGRLFYDVGQFDSFDIIPFIIGDTNTGKSTLVDIICAMFSPNSVGVLDSSHETIFGLQSKYNKELIVAPEISDKMAQQLASDMFKKMVGGELVNLPIKYSKGTSVQWKVPMFMCGSRYMDYQDVSKRLAIFRFDKHVGNIDDSLKKRIINTELSNIVVKCLRAYRMLIDHAGSQGFWKTCPDYFKDTRDDYINMFLTSGPDDNAMYFLKVKNHCMMLEDFKKKFFNYMRFRHPHVRYRWNNDFSAFKRLGYEIVYTKICRSCFKEAHAGCCTNYDNANRSTRRVIRHIMCVEQEVT